MLDEMTAALPANLTERVLEVVGRQRGGDDPIIFISHRMIEIAAVCDRATVLREGETSASSTSPRARKTGSWSSCSARSLKSCRRSPSGRWLRGRPRRRPGSTFAGLSAEPKLRDASFGCSR